MEKRKIYVPADSKYLECMQQAFNNFMIEIFTRAWIEGAFLRMGDRLKLNHSVNFNELKKIHKFNPLTSPIEMLNDSNAKIILIDRMQDGLHTVSQSKFTLTE